MRFHYQTKTCYENEEQKVIDDSKKIGKPMELIIGKKFKFEVWEAIVKKMSLNEVAKFRVNKSVRKLTIQPIIAMVVFNVVALSARSSISIYIKNTTRHWKAQRGKKTLLWYDNSKWGYWIQGFGRSVYQTVWSWIHHW